MVDNEEKVNDAASGSSGGDQGSSNRQLTMVSFLKPVLKQIIMAGKSMQLLRNLDCKEVGQSQRSSRGQCLASGAFSVSVQRVAVFYSEFQHFTFQMQRGRVYTHCFWSQCSHDSAAKTNFQ